MEMYIITSFFLKFKSSIVMHLKHGRSKKVTNNNYIKTVSITMLKNTKNLWKNWRLELACQQYWSYYNIFNGGTWRGAEDFGRRPLQRKTYIVQTVLLSLLLLFILKQPSF